MGGRDEGPGWGSVYLTLLMNDVWIVGAVTNWRENYHQEIPGSNVGNVFE